MFEPQDNPRLFAVPLGTDLPQALIRGLEQRLAGRPPEAWAGVEIYVPTRRMHRRIRELFANGPPRLLPRIRTIAELGQDPGFADLPQAVPALRRRLELTRLVRRLLDKEPDLAPRASLFDLADSLAGLMDEMQGEGVGPEALKSLDVANHSAYWQRSLRFLEIIAPYFGATRADEPDAEARQRLVIERMVARWQAAPPDHPVLVAGSTGSRGATSMFLRAVAGLPQGAVILPGFDTDLPAPVWQRLATPASGEMRGEDHPQYRFAALYAALGADPSDPALWAPDCPVANPERNRLVSLALRPAPVTHQWLEEGARIDSAMLTRATGDLSLIEAASPREEAVAIALRLRKAVADGQPAALITPDRVLTRQVTAALDRWGIEPDDSAGQPLGLSPPGRFLRQVSGLFGQRLTSVALLALLKHPLTASGGDRGDHLRFSRDLELELLREGLPFPTPADLTGWAETHHQGDTARLEWARWLAGLLEGLEQIGTAPLAAHVSRHLTLAEALAAGPEKGPENGAQTDPAAAGGLWDKPAGRKAREVTQELAREAGVAGRLDAADYRALFRAVLNRGEVHDPDSPHPGVMIWGTLEARVQGAALVILAGLNDGAWPEMPPPDPWLNRRMREDAGLLLPERRIGLAAHDFQQAIAAREVVLSRAIRDDEAETIPSRWLLRLQNLLAGLPDGGATALAAMRRRGREWLAMAAQLDMREPVPPAPRPAPRPPVAHRPDRLSVTRVGLLVRDPYAIYAAYILRLRALGPLQRTPDAPLRGTVLHQIAENFIAAGTPPDSPQARDALMQVAAEVLAREVPWPAARIFWLARLQKVAAQFLADEALRQRDGENLKNEVWGHYSLADLGFTLTAKADRIDRLHAGGLAIYDYKSGSLPTRKARALFDKQLMLEAVIARAGGFEGIAAGPVGRTGYIPLGKAEPFRPDPVSDADIAETEAGLRTLIAAYRQPSQGYTAMRLDPKLGFDSDYQHLARFGEWELSQLPEPEEVGQ